MAHDHETSGILDLWRELPPDLRLKMAAVFWEDAESVTQHIEAVHAMAKQFKFRPQSILKLPIDRRARQLAGMSKVPEGVAARALVAYHLTERRPMLEAFLDALGIPHEHGVIDETPAGPPDPERLTSAVDALVSAYPAADVRLYLRALTAQDPDVWSGLRALLPA